MKRRQFFGALAVAAWGILGAGLGRATAQSRRKVTLKEQLEFGLKARRPEEFAYIQHIVNMVDSKTLPRRIVNMAFQWSRKRQPYPYQYFTRALVVLARREGIVVPSSP